MMRQLEQMMRRLMNQASTMTSAAEARGYSSDHQSQINDLLNRSDLSVEDKFLMLAQLVGEKMDRDIEKKMKEAHGAENKKKGGGFLDFLKKIGTGVASLFGGPVGAAIAGVASKLIDGAANAGGKKKKSSELVRLELQRMMDKKNQLMSLISNVMASQNRMNNQIIQNMRG